MYAVSRHVCCVTKHETRLELIVTSWCVCVCVFVCVRVYVSVFVCVFERCIQDTIYGQVFKYTVIRVCA